MSSSDPMIGRYLFNRRYQIDKMIGEGGIARVYVATDTKYRDKVAIKRIPFTAGLLPDNPLFEARLLVGLDHPHLPRIRKLFRDPEAHYIVMQFVPGLTLDEFVRRQRGNLSPRHIVELEMHLLHVLSYLHSRKPPIIHRDVKPNNLKFNTDNTLMLVDFGIAKEWSPDERTRMFQRGYTHGYAPPEQYRGGTDARSDLFAAGGVLYFMLTGSHPEDAMQRAAQNRPYLDPRERNPQVPMELANIVRKATALAVAERFTSAAEMWHTLHNLYERLPSTGMNVPVGEVLQGTAVPTMHGRTQRGRSQQSNARGYRPPKKPQSPLQTLFIGVISAFLLLGGLMTVIYLGSGTTPAGAGNSNVLVIATPTAIPISIAPTPRTPNNLIMTGPELNFSWAFPETVPENLRFWVVLHRKGEPNGLSAGYALPTARSLTVDLRQVAGPLYAGEWTWQLAVTDQQDNAISPWSGSLPFEVVAP